MIMCMVICNELHSKHSSKAWTLVQRCHRGHSADVLQFPQEQPSSLHGQRLVLKGIFHIFPYLVRVFYQGRVCQAASSRVKYLTLNLALDHRVSLCL